MTIDAPLYVPSNVTAEIDLNGHTLTRGLTSAIENGYVIKVEGTLTISDSSQDGTGILTGGFNSSSNGGGVYVSGEFTMTGGTISGNKAPENNAAGGVFVGGTFTMSGGTISSNKGVYVGGVELVDCTFIMTGGSISGNTNKDNHEKNVDLGVDGKLYLKNGITVNAVYGTPIPIGLVKISDSMAGKITADVAADDKVTVGDKLYVVKDKTVTLTVDSSVAKVSYKAGSAAPVLVTPVNGVYSFTMPESDVTVSDDMAGSGTAADPYLISTPDDLEQFADIVNGANGQTKNTSACAKLIKDIEFTHTSDWNDYDSEENNFTPIGCDKSHYYEGTFDGQGHTISGIRVYDGGSANSADNKGLFGALSKGTVKNVVLTDTRITGKDDVGGIAGISVGTIQNCSVTDTVAINAVANGLGYHGGILGCGNGTIINNCTSSATLKCKDGLTNCNYFGGIAGCIFYQKNTTSNLAVNVKLAGPIGNKGALFGYIDFDDVVLNYSNNYYTGCTNGVTATPNGDDSTDDRAVPVPDGSHLVTVPAGVTSADTGKAAIGYPINYIYAGGETVRLTADTTVAGLSYKAGSAAEVKLTPENGVYSFEMPESDVTVIAEPWKEVRTWTDLRNKLEDGKSVKLVADIKCDTGSIYVGNSSNITLDLNGYGLIINDEPAIGVTETATLTLKDSSPNRATRYIKLNDNGRGIDICSTAEAAGSNHLVVTGGFITGAKLGVYAYGGCFKMTGGTICGCCEGSGGGAYITNNGTFIMTGGVITGNKCLSSNQNIKFGSDCDFYLKAGLTAPDNIMYTTLSSSAIRIGEVKLNSTIPSGKITVSGADTDKFDVDGVPYFIAGKTVTLNVDKTISAVSYNDGTDHALTVSNGTCSFTMPEKNVTINAEASGVVTSWDDLKTNLEAGKSCVLTENLNAGSGKTGIVIPATADVTLDLNGKTLSRGLSSAGENGFVFSVNGKLTVVDNGTGGRITGGYDSEKGGITVNNGGRFTLTSGTITGCHSGGNGGGVQVNSGGTFVMTGGAVTGNSASTNTGNNVYVASGGAFYQKAGISVTADGSYTIKHIGSVTVSESIANGTVTASLPTFDVLGTKYYVEGETVTLTVAPDPDCSIETVTYNDGTAHTITPVSDVYSFEMPAVNVTVSAVFSKPTVSVSTWDALRTAFANGNDVKLTGDIITETNAQPAECKEGSTVTLDLNGYGIVFKGSTSVFSVLNSTLILKDSSTNKTTRYVILDDSGCGTSVFGSKPGEGTNYIEVSGGFITGNNYSGVFASFAFMYSSFVMTGGTICGCLSSGYGNIYVAMGTFIMTGGTITGNKSRDNDNKVYLGDSAFYTRAGVSGLNVVESDIDTVYAHIGDVSVSSGIKNGTVTVSAEAEDKVSVFDSEYIVEGKTVTVTLAPATGYALKELHITKVGDATTTVTTTGSGNTWTFTMPAYDVNVSASFKSATAVEYHHHPAKAPTCTKKGYYEYYTDDEDNVYVLENGVYKPTTLEAVTRPKRGHSYDWTVTKEATCTEPGEKTGVCKRCQHEETQEIPALGHSEVTTEEIKVEPTCTEDGSGFDVVKCERCGEEISRTEKVIPALGHSPAPAVEEVTVAATCTEDGSGFDVVKCERCGIEISRTEKVLPALGHDLETVRLNEKEADCMTDGGYVEVTRCKRCGLEISRETVVIQKLGHDFVDGVCTRCGAVEVKPGKLADELDKLTGDKVIISLDGDETMPKITFPKDVKELTIDGGGHTLTFTGSSITMKPFGKLILANVTIQATKNGKPQAITLTAAKSGLVLENVTFQGKKTTINAKKGDLTLGDITAKDLNVNGAKSTTLTVDGDVDVAKINGFGKVIIEGNLTVKKSLTADYLEFAAGGTLTVESGATITVSKGVSGNGTIKLCEGYKSITLKGSASGKIMLTADKPLAEGAQIFKSSLTNLNDVFDVHGIAPVVNDGTYEYGLYVKSNKAYLRAFKLQLGGKTFCEISDLMASISAAKDASKTYEMKVLGDMKVSSLNLPKKGTYKGLTINGNGHTMTLQNNALTLTGDLTLENVTIASAKGAWTIKTNGFKLTADPDKLINCTIK